MEIYVDLQIVTKTPENIPDESSLTQWVKAAIKASNSKKRDEAELTIRVVERDESNQLNLQFRAKDKPTNVLSFPFQNPPGLTLPLLGDLIICQAIIEEEAKQQKKTDQAHWAHMVIHGTLHLLGYDHIENEEALEMEALETNILVTLGFPPPYTEQ